jgi:DNA-binding response OmpR family regulator
MNDRRNSGPQDVLSFGPFSLFAAERLLKKADEPIPKGGRALDILIVLAQRAGEVYESERNDQTAMAVIGQTNAMR